MDNVFTKIGKFLGSIIAILLLVLVISLLSFLVVLLVTNQLYLF